MTMRFVRVRWIFALLSMLVSIWLMTAAFKINGFGALGHIIFSMTGFIMAVLLIAPETVFRIAEWISRPFAELFFPSEEYKKPPLSYKMARRVSRRPPPNTKRSSTTIRRSMMLMWNCWRSRRSSKTTSSTASAPRRYGNVFMKRCRPCQRQTPALEALEAEMRLIRKRVDGMRSPNAAT